MTSRVRLRKQDAVRREVFQAALTLFAAHGYEATTMDQIAEASGISRRTLFRYYASKDDLMVRAIDTYGDLLAAAIRGAEPGLAPLALIRHVATALVGRVLQEPRVREMMAVTVENPGARKAQLLELEGVADRVAVEYRRVLGRRPRAQATSRVMASMTMVVLTQAFRAWYDNPRVRVEHVVDDLLDAVAQMAVSAAAPRSRGRRS